MKKSEAIMFTALHLDVWVSAQKQFNVPFVESVALFIKYYKLPLSLEEALSNYKRPIS